jgi:c-di-GMP-binding flagellar brake protein YcgR
MLPFPGYNRTPYRKCHFWQRRYYYRCQL